jgi:hypothetical protein
LKILNPIPKRQADTEHTMETTTPIKAPGLRPAMVLPVDDEDALPVGDEAVDVDAEPGLGVDVFPVARDEVRNAAAHGHGGTDLGYLVLSRRLA